MIIYMKSGAQANYQTFIILSRMMLGFQAVGFLVNILRQVGSQRAACSRGGN